MSGRAGRKILFPVVAATAVAVTAFGGAYAAPTAGAKPGTAALTLPAPPARFVQPGPFVRLVGPDTPVYAGPSTPRSLDRVAIAASLRAVLKSVPGLRGRLAKQGFAVVPSGSGLFSEEYEGNIYGGWPVYVTTDAAYNAWHLVFDKMLRDLEQKVLLPKLEQLVTLLLAGAHRQAAALAGTPLADPAGRVEQLFQVVAAELGQRVSLGPLAAREKALVDAHSAPRAVSPLLGTPLDYSFFTPRGHYTLNRQLTRFFVAMSVLGNEGLCLPGTRLCPGLGPARMGILAARLFDGDTRLTSLWHALYDPTSFLVGFADDYTPLEVNAAYRAALGSAGVAALASDAKVSAVLRALTAARPVRINPDRASIRIMGTRYVTDAYMFQQLVYPHVGTEAKPRLMPSALDIASVLGSKLAHQVMDGAGANAFARYDSQVQALQQAVVKREPAAWQATVYDAWLSALQPVFVPHGTAFPDYMRSPAWAAKDLQAGLGSYTELKHDTILFAKQIVAEAGGEPSQARPQNWVEPEPVAFLRLATAADLLQRGLQRLHLLTSSTRGLLGSELGLFRFLGRVARDELAGKPLASADNDRLRSVGDALSAIWWSTSAGAAADIRMPAETALVADIATAPVGVLEIATGRVETLFVVVPVHGGGFELARGGVYSTYEFTSPPGVRLTDDAWRALLAAGKAPARPAWQTPIRVPCPGKAARGCVPNWIPG